MQFYYTILYFLVNLICGLYRTFLWWLCLAVVGMLLFIIQSLSHIGLFMTP